MIPNHLQAIANLFPIAKDPRLQRGFAQILNDLIRTQSCILSEWARHHLLFDAFIKKVSRFFRNKHCQWSLEETILTWILPRFEKKKYIPVLIDPSFVSNRYLGTFTKTRSDQKEAKKGFFLFSAALPVKGRAISFFQACYRLSQIEYVHESLNKLLGLYLVKIAQILKPHLSKTVFIMDRGFGYEFFLKKMTELKTHYVLRARDLSTRVILQRSQTITSENLSRKKKTSPTSNSPGKSGSTLTIPWITSYPSYFAL